jgi:FK506-binding protein 2
MAKFRIATVLALVACFAFVFADAKVEKDVTELQIGVKFKPKTCELKAHKGDQVSVHYRGTLVDGTEFDESYGRGQPLDFALGQGSVIKGWDQGILGMCVGEKRKLKIPAKLGYGAQGAPPKIPGGATLIFETELVAVNGRTGTGPDDLVEPLPSGNGDMDFEDDDEDGDEL